MKLGSLLIFLRSTTVEWRASYPILRKILLKILLTLLLLLSPFIVREKYSSSKGRVAYYFKIVFEEKLNKYAQVAW